MMLTTQSPLIAMLVIAVGVALGGYLGEMLINRIQPVDRLIRLLQPLTRILPWLFWKPYVITFFDEDYPGLRFRTVQAAHLELARRREIVRAQLRESGVDEESLEKWNYRDEVTKVHHDPRKPFLRYFLRGY